MIESFPGRIFTVEEANCLVGDDVPPGTVPLPMLDLEPPVALEVGAS